MSKVLMFAEMTVEQLEAHIAANQAQNKAEHDARQKRTDQNRALKQHLARMTAQCWVLVTLDNGMDSAVIPVSEKVPSYYQDLTFTVDPQIEDLENVTVIRKPGKEVKIQIQTETGSGAFVRLLRGKSITVGVDYTNNKKITFTREYTVTSFATEAAAVAQQTKDNEHEAFL